MRRSASLLRSLIRNSGVRQRRCINSLSDNLVEELDNPVLVEGNAWSRTAILHRPSVLNALNTAMAARLLKLYKSWEDNPDIGFVMSKGSGRSFSAGGDIVSLYHLVNQGNIEAAKGFFKTLYSFIYLVGTYLKPHVAILNGITMGGGAGISIPGTFKVATDRTAKWLPEILLAASRGGSINLDSLNSLRTHFGSNFIRVFATPETLIGFHPDAAASFYLSHLPGYLGEYLALTGNKLSGAEMIGCGLATHYVLSDRLPLMEEQLRKLVTDDPSVIETFLSEFSDVVYPDRNSVLYRCEIVDKCFGQDTVEEILDALENEAARTNDDWCVNTLNKLKLASPLSLKVALRSIREGRFQTFDQCLIREYQMSIQGISKQISNDYCEGVRARLVDKDSAPKWNPSSLQQVSKDMVDQYFCCVRDSEPGLELPIKSREAFV